jgi:hypothetical protein
MKIYCHKHDEIHNISEHTAVRLISQYQYRIIEAAKSEPIIDSPLTSFDAILQNAFCVKEDDKLMIPTWREHVKTTAARARELGRLTNQRVQNVRRREARRQTVTEIPN